jgi:hypothetical protein
MCNFAAVLYGCETWFLTIREECRLEKKVLRIFRSKREEVTAGWRRLHTEELHNFNASPNIIRMMK